MSQTADDYRRFIESKTQLTDAGGFAPLWVPHLPASEANMGGRRQAAIARKTAIKEAAHPDGVLRRARPAGVGVYDPAHVRRAGRWR